MDLQEKERASIEAFLKEKNLENEKRGYSSENLTRVKYYILTGISAVVLIFGFLFYRVTLKVAQKPVNFGPKEGIRVDSFGNAFFKPGTTQAKNRYSGKVDYALEVNDNPVIKHKLLDKDGNTMLYLHSSNHDLDLSVGLDADLEGEMNITKYNDINIFEVESIQLK